MSRIVSKLRCLPRRAFDRRVCAMDVDQDVACCVNIHEYQAKGSASQLRGARSRTAASSEAGRRGEDGGGRTRRPALGGQGADPRRRPRQGQLQGGLAGEKGGVRLARSVEEAADEAKRHARPHAGHAPDRPAGKQVNRIYIEDGSDIARELYLALLVDRQTSRISFVCSTEGGMDIEEVAASTPEKILSFTVDPATGISGLPRPPRRLRAGAGGQAGQAMRRPGEQALQALRREGHAEMLEINPLIVTDDGDLKCLDAKMGFDSNALYRQPEIGAARRDRGGPQGTRRLEVRPQLHRARRRDRLHGQRRGPRHGDDGHHQALRRGARELPRRGRRRHARRR
jgi:succinyl-CoA synthetase beta subunit